MGTFDGKQMGNTWQTQGKHTREARANSFDTVKDTVNVSEISF